MSNKGKLSSIKPNPGRTIPAFYRLSQAAGIVGCSELTLKRAIKNGELKVLQPTGVGGDIIVPMGNLDAFIRARNK
jgi:hypothetical protein